MTSSYDVIPTPSDVADVFSGGGEMGALMRALDWSQTPLGPPEIWSPTLRTMVRILLANRFPLLLWWGPDHSQLYNDAYRPVLGAKHPQYLGRPGRECWSEIWDVIGPLVQTPYTGGPATWDDDIFLVVRRHGFAEETHFTIAYSPIPDDTVPSGIGGVLATVHEITRQVIQERRAVALRDLGARSSEAKSAEKACEIAAAALAQHPKDIPFALLYLLDADRQAAHLAGAAGTEAGQPFSPPIIGLAGSDEDQPAWPLGEVVRSEQPLLVERLQERCGTVPRGPWSDPPSRALVLPIRSNIQHRLAGVLVLGISAWLDFDDLYRGFCDLVTAQVATAIANARAYEEERKRAEALAALDQAKTAFFSNISHEFRTPLTLMLGPLEDALAQPDALSAADRERLTVAHRNAMRLLRLVNTLLDFSRIEAGRVQASYEPTDLPTLTAELASTFRSALERAGLRLIVDCLPLPPGVAAYVDREMWEKIVLNLLSNAFKFTFAGEIEVGMRSAGEKLELVVRDTGIGIAADELPRLFERFHRVEGTRARTVEGTGIGLALVQELVRLHGGEIVVESTLGSGTTFTVTIPTGTAHLPADRIGAPRSQASTALGSAPFLDEALGWLTDDAVVAGDRPPTLAASPLASDAETPPASGQTVPAAPPADPARPRILVADDNRDMRDYVVRLLSPAYTVEAVADGEQALAAITAHPPDLILSDVMMPRLDGFGLVAALRADPRTHEIPIILLSARAGEEARIEGVQTGADDYLIKPFAARELLARVEGRLELARLRTRAKEQEVQARQAAEAATRARDEFLSIASHELRNPVAGIKGAAQLLQRMRRTGRLDDERLDRYLTSIEVGSNRLTTLTEDLLDVARLQQGALPLRPRPTDLVALIQDVISRLPEPTRPRVQADLAGGIEPMMVDPDRIEQVVVNLLDNAAKYSPTDSPIQVSLERDGADLVLRVRDQGIGLPVGVAEQIFQPFGRAPNAVAANIPGLGLGLYICRQITQQHGGSLWAESDGEGQGATLLVRLPSAPPGKTEPRDG